MYLAPTRCGRQRRLPRRFQDELPPSAPHIPAPTIALPEEPLPPPPDEPHMDTTVSTPAFRIFKTRSNSYGIYRLYLGGRPSWFPKTRSTAEMYNSPAFEALQTTPKRPWWAVFGKSLKAVAENLYAPFKNATTYLFMHWADTGANSKSATELDRLARLLQDPRFNPKDLQGFRADYEAKRLDTYINSSLDTKALFKTCDGWISGSVALPLPCEGRKQKLEEAPCFPVNGVFYRKPLDVLRSALHGPAEEHLNLFPFQEYWKSSDDAEPERIFSELYNSDVFIHTHQQLNHHLSETGGPRPRLEAVIAAIMLWSDSTHLASFGTASLWPIYMFIGNFSKYLRCMTSLLMAEHLAYIPKVQ